MIRPVTCAICRKALPLGEDGTCATFPFCSERCRQIDFFRWFDGKYAITEPLDPDAIDDSAESERGGETSHDDIY